MAWNKPSTENQQPTKKSASKAHSAKRGIIAGVVVVALGALCLWMFSGENVEPKAKVDKERGCIKEVCPTISTNANIVGDASLASKRHSNISTNGLPRGVAPDEHGVLRYKSGLRYVSKDSKLKSTPRPRDPECIFKHHCENSIASLLVADPEKFAPFLIGDRHPFDARFIEDFRRSLAEPIEIKEEDSPQDKELKQAVIDTKAELSAAMRKGENIAQIMNDAWANLDKEARYINDMKDQLREIVSNDKYTDRDVEDFVTAANQMLANNGLANLSMPNLKTRQLRLQIKRKKAQLQEQSNAKNAKE